MEVGGGGGGSRRSHFRHRDNDGGLRSCDHRDGGRRVRRWLAVSFIMDVVEIAGIQTRAPGDPNVMVFAVFAVVPRVVGARPVAFVMLVGRLFAGAESGAVGHANG